MKFKNIAHFLIYFTCINFAIAQTTTDKLGNWAMFFNQTKITSKFSLHSEIQFRSYDIQPNTEQLLIRWGVNFHYKPNLMLTAGHGWITNYNDDGEMFKPWTVNENRIWQQVVLKNNIDRTFIEHRYRLEQRWIEKNSITDLKHRVRYLLRVSIPINTKTIEKKTLFLSFYDEVFINLGAAPLDRNRLFGAIGYQFSSSGNIQFGYLAQTIGVYTKQYLQLAINYNLDFRKTE